MSPEQADRGEVRREANQSPNRVMRERQQSNAVSVVPTVEGNSVADGKMGSKMIDLNARPQRTGGQFQNHQVRVSESQNVKVMFYP